MTEQRELRIPFDDLLVIVLECDCGAEVAVDFNKERVQKTDWEHSAFKCPVCRKDFDSNLRLGFEHFIRWQEQIKASGQTIYFRIRTSN